MAKKSMIYRDIKRSKIVKKYREKRLALKKQIMDLSLSFEKRQEAVLALQKLPRNASPIRVRNRCALSGRPHGYYSKFGLAKTKLRERAVTAQIPGLTKSSW